MRLVTVYLYSVAYEIAKILNTGLDRETVSIIIGLCEVRWLPRTTIAPHQRARIWAMASC